MWTFALSGSRFEALHSVMAAETSLDLKTITEREYAKLRGLIDTLPKAQALLKRDDDTSIKDVIGHRAHWIELFLGWYHDGQAGKEVFFPAKGYKWNALKAYNAALRQAQIELDWEGACQLLAAHHAELLSFIDSHSEAELYGGPMQGARNAWTPGRWAEAAGASHYRSASKWIRACVRADARSSET